MTLWAKKQKDGSYKIEPGESIFVHDLCEYIRTGPIETIELNTHGISLLEYDFHGKKVLISWYSSETLRDFSFGYKSYPFGSEDIKKFLDAAIHRAKSLYDEEKIKIERWYENVRRNETNTDKSS